MAQIFPKSANAIARASVYGAIFVLIFAGWAFDALNRSAYNTRAFMAREQPIPFSHAHHVGGLGLDCRYCHTSVERSSFAGIPPTKTCMNCHSQIWSTSPMLEPVRASFRTGQSIRWTRVHDLPDFVYFNHSIHVNKGVGCESCHGRVDKMPLTWRWPRCRWIGAWTATAIRKRCCGHRRSLPRWAISRQATRRKSGAG